MCTCCPLIAWCPILDEFSPHSWCSQYRLWISCIPQQDKLFTEDEYVNGFAISMETGGIFSHSEFTLINRQRTFGKYVN